MKLWQSLPVVGVCVLAAVQARAIGSCKYVDNKKSCEIDIAVVQLKLGPPSSPPTCGIFLRQGWVGFTQEKEITWTIKKLFSSQPQAVLLDISFDTPAKFAPGASSPTSRTYTFKRSDADAGRDYKYTVKAKIDGVECEIDPWVRNQ